ncbi:MAG: hypothetical protein FWH54_00900 [Methanobrevibacter sp.]|nr:hypothetical protein [Methanobrevibacter sp.]
MDLNLGNGYAETSLEQIIVKNVRINKENILKPTFDDLNFYANLKSKDDYLKLLEYGIFHIELESGKILVDCKLDDSVSFVNENTDIKGDYSFSRL